MAWHGIQREMKSRPCAQTYHHHEPRSRRERCIMYCYVLVVVVVMRTTRQCPLIFFLVRQELDGKKYTDRLVWRIIMSVCVHTCVSLPILPILPLFLEQIELEGKQEKTEGRKSDLDVYVQERFRSRCEWEEWNGNAHRSHMHASCTCSFLILQSVIQSYSVLHLFISDEQFLTTTSSQGVVHWTLQFSFKQTYWEYKDTQCLFFHQMIYSCKTLTHLTCSWERERGRDRVYPQTRLQPNKNSLLFSSSK